MSNVILITKDALSKRSLPVYGNKYWKTPNMDELAKKGTVFNKHYAGGTSTAMTFLTMATGEYCYKSNRREYKNEEAIRENTLFDKAYDLGYECHILWDETYTDFAKSHFKCEGLHTVIHGLPHIKQYGSKHKRGVFDDVTPVEIETQEALKTIRNELEKVKREATRDIFLWMHLPHVLRGRQGYGSDIDVFDEIIGIAREIYGDDDIFISADHGHMDGAKNKYRYGFDVEDDVICVPMIAPKLQGETEISYPTSTIQLYDILLKRMVPQLEYVISETAYYAQPKRKIAIIKGKYKYCYSKEDKKEALYDMEFDKGERYNLVYPEVYDVDRFLWYSTAQCFFYPYWKESRQALEELRGIKDNLWRTGTFTEEWINKILHRVKCLYFKYKLANPKKYIKNTGK